MVLSQGSMTVTFSTKRLNTALVPIRKKWQVTEKIEERVCLNSPILQGLD